MELAQKRILTGCISVQPVHQTGCSVVSKTELLLVIDSVNKIGVIDVGIDSKFVEVGKRITENHFKLCVDVDHHERAMISQAVVGEQADHCDKLLVMLSFESAVLSC
jgi:hypothetical protein